jgi:hypothetical protein
MKQASGALLLPVCAHERLHRTFTVRTRVPRDPQGMTVTIRRRKRSIDAGEIGLSALLLSIYASARGTAIALGAARALLP